MITTILIVNCVCSLSLVLFAVQQRMKVSRLEKKLQNFDQRIKLENSASHGMGLQLYKLRSDINQKMRLLRNQVIASDVTLRDKQSRRGPELKSSNISRQEQQLARKMSATA